MIKELSIENIKTASQLGVALKRLRKASGLTQTQLAEQINIRQATISEVESGRGTLDSFLKIVQALGLYLTLGNHRQQSSSTKDQDWLMNAMQGDD